MNDPHGQVLIILALLLVVVLVILAGLADTGRLLIEKQELQQAAAAGGKSGMVYVGDVMLTQLEPIFRETAQLQATLQPVTTASLTAPYPQGPDRQLGEYLSDQDRAYLTSPPIRTAVADQVMAQFDANGYQIGDNGVVSIEVQYPYRYQLSREELEILVRITKSIPLSFFKIFRSDSGVVTGESQQFIIQR